MKKIYYKDADGNKIVIAVSDEVATAYKEERQKMWREDAYHAYYTTSLDRILERGHDFRDLNLNAEEMEMAADTQKEHDWQLHKLRIAYDKLTMKQKNTLYKLFVLNMSQAQIAKQEGVLESAVTHRVKAIYSRIKQLLKKI